MAFRATQAISDLFTLRDIKHRIDDSNKKYNRVLVTFPGDEACGIEVAFFSSDNELNDVSIRVDNLTNLRVPEDRQLSVLEELNRLNNKYRYVKFCLRENRTVSVVCDLGSETSDAKLGVICHEILVRFRNIIDESIMSIADAIVNG